MAKIPPRPPSMQEVAIAAGVHQTTVSLALRNDRRLPESTRLRIQRIAQKMNYRSHPLVAALVAFRRTRGPARVHATIAFIVRSSCSGNTEQHLAGARDTAEQQGYRLDLFTLGGADLGEQRLDDVLRVRNIHGTIIAPLPEARGHFDLDWGNFSNVVIEYSFDAPVFDRVVHDYFGGMRRIMHECRCRAISRVGLVLSTSGYERTDRLIGAGFWVEQRAGRFFASIPPLILPVWDGAAFTAWHRRHRPDGIVTSNVFIPQIEAWSAQRRLRLGSDVHLVNVNAAAGGPVSGIFQNPYAIGASAARLVIEKIIRNERGVPARPLTTISPGTWVEGSTLRPLPSSPPRPVSAVREIRI